MRSREGFIPNGRLTVIGLTCHCPCWSTVVAKVPKDPFMLKRPSPEVYPTVTMMVSPGLPVPATINLREKGELSPGLVILGEGGRTVAMVIGKDADWLAFLPSGAVKSTVTGT